MSFPSTSLPPTALRYLLATSLSIGLLASTHSAAACEVDADCGFGFACIHESVGADSGGSIGSVTGGSGGTSSTICDNGTCEFGESFDTCPEDCDEVTSCQPAVCETNDDCAEGYECTLVGGSTATNGSGGIITETFYECRAEVVRCTTDDECAEGETCQFVSSSSGTSAGTGSGGAQSATSDDTATSGSDGTDGGSDGTDGGSDSAGTDTTASGGSAGIGGSGGSSGAGQGGGSSELGYCTTDWDGSGGSGGTDAGSTDASGSTSRGDTTGNASTTGGSATASSGSGGTVSAGQGGSEGDASGSDGTSASATGAGNQSASSASSDGSGNTGDSNADGDGDDDGGWSCALVGWKATTRSHLGALGALGFLMLGGLFRRRRQSRR